MLAVRELMPRYVRQHPSSELTGEIDHFSLTLAGLLASIRAEEASKVIDGVLGLIGSKYDENASFSQYTLDEVRTTLGITDKVNNFPLNAIRVAGLTHGGGGSGSQHTFGAPTDTEDLSDHRTFPAFIEYLRKGTSHRPSPTAPLVLQDDPAAESQVDSQYLPSMPDPNVGQKWGRLKTVVRAAEAVILGEPKPLAPLGPMAKRSLEVLEAPPSAESAEELEYLLGRMEEFVAKWRPNPSREPGTFYMQPGWAKSTDAEVQEARRLLREIREGGIERSDQAVPRSENSMKVFVSHSSADQALAEAFVDFLRAALPIPPKDIRCTSVSGYKLPAGTNSDEQLRQEVFDAEVFVALLSPASVKSVYVMFELGARWGAKRHLIPVMVRGLDPSYLKPPISAIHAIAGTSEGDLHQLVAELATRLGLDAEKPQVYARALHALIAAATAP